MITLIDGDTIPWIVAYNHREKDDTDAALKNVDEFVRSLLNATSCSKYAGFLGGTPCFRYDIAKHKPYKGGRPSPPDWYVKWGGVMKAFLRDEWNFQVVNGIEADDAVSIAQYRLMGEGLNSVICGGDKDLLTIPGNHYSLRTHKRRYIDEEEAHKILCAQMLTGDAIDGIEGVKGIGKVGAQKIVDAHDNGLDLSIAIIEEFEKKHGKEYGNKLYWETYRLCSMIKYMPELEIPFHDYSKKEAVKIEPSITLDDLKDIWG